MKSTEVKRVFTTKILESQLDALDTIRKNKGIIREKIVQDALANELKKYSGGC